MWEKSIHKQCLNEINESKKWNGSRRTKGLNNKLDMGRVDIHFDRNHREEEECVSE